MGKPEFFDELKNLSKEKQNTVSSNIDNVYGDENIGNHFKNLYQNLYNEQQGVDEAMFDQLNYEVSIKQCQSLELIELFSPELVKTATKKLKSDKADVTGHFTSDCLISAPDSFFAYLSALFKGFLYHGYVSPTLLECALHPIVKDPNGDISSSKNYRGIAISSLILKVFDNCILLLMGNLLSHGLCR